MRSTCLSISGAALLVGLVFARVGRIDLRQANLRAGLDHEFFAKVHAVSPVTTPLATLFGSRHRRSRCARSSPAVRSDRWRSARRSGGRRRARTSRRCCTPNTHPISVHGIAGTSQPKPHISTATIWVSRIATNSGAAGNGGRKNQRSRSGDEQQQMAAGHQLQEHHRLQLILGRQSENSPASADASRTRMPIISRPNDSMIENSPSTIETPSSLGICQRIGFALTGVLS